MFASELVNEVASVLLTGRISSSVMYVSKSFIKLSTSYSLYQ